MAEQSRASLQTVEKGALSKVLRLNFIWQRRRFGDGWISHRLLSLDSCATSVLTSGVSAAAAAAVCVYLGSRSCWAQRCWGCWLWAAWRRMATSRLWEGWQRRSSGELKVGHRFSGCPGVHMDMDDTGDGGHGGKPASENSHFPRFTRVLDDGNMGWLTLTWKKNVSSFNCRQFCKKQIKKRWICCFGVLFASFSERQLCCCNLPRIKNCCAALKTHFKWNKNWLKK